MTSNVYAIIKDRYIYKPDIDGSKKVFLSQLRSKDFSSMDVYHEFKKQIGYVHTAVTKSMNFPENSEERNRFLNNAAENLKAVYAILTAECLLFDGGCNIPEYGLTAGRRMIDYWLAHGEFARFKIVIDSDTELPTDGSFAKSANALQKDILNDCYNIIHGIERIKTTADAESALKFIDNAEKFVKKQAEKQAKLAKQAAEREKKIAEKAAEKAAREAERERKAAEKAAAKAAKDAEKAA